MSDATLHSLVTSFDRVNQLGEAQKEGDRYSKKAIANGGTMMFYIQILNRPPHQKLNLEVSKPISDLEQGLLVQDRQAEVRKRHQKTIENYHLQRRLFI